MLPFVGGGVPGPHMFGDLEDFFQLLKAFFHGRENHAQTLGLVLEPGGTNPEVGSTAG